MVEQDNQKRDRFNIKNSYFNELKETSSHIIPYVLDTINNSFNMVPELKENLIAKFSESKTQLRPSQVKFAYLLAKGETKWGKDWEEIIPACAAVALKDIFYYHIDDIIDLGSTLKKESLMGIPFLSLSYKSVIDLYPNFSSSQINNVTKELFKLDELNAQGFLLEDKMELSDESAYMGKVYGYNFCEQAMRIGANLGTLDEKKIKIIGEIGKNIGMAYIIANDTWDFGKDLEDFRYGKMTFPIAWAIRNTKQRDTLESLLGKQNLSGEEMDEVRLIVVRSGAIDEGKNKAKEFCNMAKSLLQYFPDSYWKKMINFSMTMTQKNKYFDILKKYER